MDRSKTAKIHVCGVTCHQGDANCNGYCTDPEVPHAKLIEAPSGDAAIEAEIVAKGLTAPRVTPADLEANITSQFYFTAGDGVRGRSEGGITPAGNAKSLDFLTFCVLVLRNGYTVTGESACASPENFDAELGQKIARANAVQKIWPLMGYQLRETLAQKR